MALTILINVAPHEARLAVMEKGKLVDFEVEREGRLVGNVYKGRVVNIVPGMDAAFVDIGLSRNAFLYVGDVVPDALEAGEEFAPYSSIQEALNVGEEVVVQIARPPVSGKGARVTTRISLPGRYLVLLSHTPEHVGISRKITQPEERSRLRRLTERIRPLDHGIIVRTEAEGRSESELLADLNELLDLWRQIEHKAAQFRAPLLLHADLGLIGRAVRDALTSEVSELLIDSEEEYHEVMEQVRRMAPHAAARVKLYTDDVPLFERYHVEQEIARALEVVVPLPSGGYIAIEETEAFTAIDVNTHRYVGKNKLADTVLQTNLEAAEEVARQLRLRDIGGVIVVDFIDMERPRDRMKVMNALEEAVRKDRTRTRIVHISPLGLVEMTRRREGRSLSQLLCRPCPYCEGKGRVRSAATVAIELRRKLERLSQRSNAEAFHVTVHPEVAAFFVGSDGESASALEEELGKKVFITVDEQAHIERTEIVAASEKDAAAQQTPLRVGECIPLPARLRTYPEQSPQFVCFDHWLVQVPDAKTADFRKATLQIQRVERWFAIGAIVPPP